KGTSRAFHRLRFRDAFVLPYGPCVMARIYAPWHEATGEDVSVLNIFREERNERSKLLRVRARREQTECPTHRECHENAPPTCCCRCIFHDEILHGNLGSAHRLRRVMVHENNRTATQSENGGVDVVRRHL